MEIDPLIHSLRWVRAYPFLAQLEAEIWRDDFDPVAKWVKASLDDPRIDWSFSFLNTPDPSLSEPEVKE